MTDQHPDELRHELLAELESWARGVAERLTADDPWRLLLGASIASAQAVYAPHEICEALRETADRIEQSGLGPPYVQ